MTVKLKFDSTKSRNKKKKNLVAQPLGPADYIALCSKYHTLVLENIPQMGVLQKNEARRFITLLDAVYETKVRMYVECF